MIELGPNRDIWSTQATQTTSLGLGLGLPDIQTPSAGFKQDAQSI
jgi:hypothetical protein